MIVVIVVEIHIVTFTTSMKIVVVVIPLKGILPRPTSLMLMRAITSSKLPTTIRT
jgi:hypothetical protein